MIERAPTRVHREIAIELKLSKVAFKATKEKAKVVTTKAIKENSTIVMKAKTQIIMEFKASEDFEMEIAEGFMAT